MKRIGLPLAAAVVLAAQPAHAQALSFGVRGGLNSATADLKGDNEYDVGNRTGFHAGLVGYVNIAKNFALQTEMMYSQKGFASGGSDIALNVTYFEIPVYAVIKMPTKVSPHVYLGFVLGLETGCKASAGDIKDVDCDTAVEQNLETPRTKGADSGVMFGGGVTLQMGPGDMLVDAIYNYGLTNVAESGGEFSSLKTRTFYLSAAYLLPIGGRGYEPPR
jgi:hypothetical protein